MALRNDVLILVAAVTGPLASAPSFLPAETCRLCHSQNGFLTQALVGHYSTWRFSMMSSASRDPYWRTRVEAELKAAGASAKTVEDKCLRCHAAADQYPLRGSGRTMGFTDLTDTGRQGVTCTVCHRIESSGLGTAASFTGGFHISPDAVLFGPHERPFAMPMLHHTGYEPVTAGHILDSALCGSCHTLLLRDSAGRVSFAEQTTYPEWLASGYAARGTGCRTCHVPAVRASNGSYASDYIAHRPPGGPFPPTRPRAPIGVHTFIGGNAQILEAMREATADAGYGDRAEATRTFLTGALSLSTTFRITGQEAVISVTVQNLTGHKLPTGLPGRRLWIHLTARDAGNRVVFESGAWDAETGRLRSGTAAEPHRETITRPDQAMIYEAVMEDSRGRLTTLLTQAARYRKDNRLLPAGFDGSRLPRWLDPNWIAPTGTSEDDDFQPGGDTVHYHVPLTQRSGALRVSVEACFQSIQPDAAGTVVPRSHRGPLIVANSALTTGVQ